jgi:hypothetical protein
MTISRSAAGLAAMACLVLFTAGCGANSGAPETGASHTPTATATATAAPSAPASTSATTPPATTPPATTPPSSQVPVPRCHTSQLVPAYTGLNAAMGGQRAMTLILTNHSGSTCYVYGYPGLAFLDGNGFAMATHLTWMNAPNAKVILHPGGNAQAMLTWRVNMDTATPFNPSIAQITPPDEYTYLWTIWQGGPVLNGDIVSWPLTAAPAGPFPAGTGTIANPFNGMCVALAGDGTTVVAWKCTPGATSQQWTGYNDGTLRINGKCLEVTGPKAGAGVTVAACTGAATQKWTIGQVSYNDFGGIINTATVNALTDPGGSTVDGTKLVMGPDRGDLSYPWRVSYHHYMIG